MTGQIRITRHCASDWPTQAFTVRRISRMVVNSDVDAKIEFVKDEKGNVTGLVLPLVGADLGGSRK